MRLAPVLRWSARAAAALLLAALVVVSPAGAGNGSSAVMPPNSKPHGHSYGEWSGAFWQWSTSLPVDDHPLFDAPGTDGSEGQMGKVWFLGGTFQSTDVGGGNFVAEADRTIRVPTGTFLFVPIVNAEADTFVDVDPDDPDLEAKLRAAANALGDAIVPESLYLTIDGKAVPNLTRFRAESPLTPIGPLPENNFYGAEAGATGFLVSDGYYAMLNPLPVGRHTIEFGGFVDATDLFGITFKLDVQYTVIVAPARKR